MAKKYLFALFFLSLSLVVRVDSANAGSSLVAMKCTSTDQAKTYLKVLKKYLQYNLYGTGIRSVVRMRKVSGNSNGHLDVAEMNAVPALLNLFSIHLFFTQLDLILSQPCSEIFVYEVSFKLPDNSVIPVSADEVTFFGHYK